LVILGNIYTIRKGACQKPKWINDLLGIEKGPSVSFGNRQPKGKFPWGLGPCWKTWSQPLVKHQGPEDRVWDPNPVLEQLPDLVGPDTCYTHGAGNLGPQTLYNLADFCDPNPC